MLDENRVSNGVKGFNSVTVNVAYLGGIDTSDKAANNRTDAQKKVLRQLFANLKKKYPEAVIQDIGTSRPTQTETAWWIRGNVLKNARVSMLS